jgi:hypothetical protein
VPSPPVSTTAEPDSSLVQKLMSAVVGSVLTSLVGRLDSTRQSEQHIGADISSTQSHHWMSFEYDYRHRKVRPPPRTYLPSSSYLPISV